MKAVSAPSEVDKRRVAEILFLIAAPLAHPAIQQSEGRQGRKAKTDDRCRSAGRNHPSPGWCRDNKACDRCKRKISNQT